MQLPFSPTEFYDVFGAYNAAAWPGALALWFISVALVALAAGMTRPPSRALSALLVVHWAWSAVAYHAAFFTDVNPMAWGSASSFFGVHADVMSPVGALVWVTSLAMPKHALNQEAPWPL